MTDKTKADKTKADKGEVYTYIGAGTEIPEVINFMGRQEFVRYEPVEVTDPVVLKKIAGCPTFVKGEPDKKEIRERDEAARKKAEDQKKKDKAKDAAEAKRNAKHV